MASVRAAMEIAGRRVLVVGMARSGVAAARLALARGARVVCADLRPEAPRIEGTAPHYGPHDRGDFLGADLIVVSPGVPARQPDLAAAAAAGVPIVGELGFAAWHLDMPLLAITGTNGKSTCTHLLGQILAQAGRRPFVGGNLGRPLSEAALEPGSFDVGAVEVSSYQMELPGGFRPAAAVVLNLTPDHLERHGTMENYAAHKCRLFAEMGEEDRWLIPDDSPILAAAAAGGRGRGEAARIASMVDGLDLSRFGLPGRHNRENLAAALWLAGRVGVRPDQIDLGALRGLAHRLEVVGERRGARWINDSKATNVDATLVALEAVPGAIVLLGGRGKAGAPYHLLIEPLRGGPTPICFGEEGPVIAAALAGGADGAPGIAAEVVPDLAAAVRRAADRAAELAAGGAVLLSPACASFDEFRNFEHRGEVYSQLVSGLG